MKTFKTLLSAVLLTLGMAATSPAVVGYINYTLRPGDNLVANQLDNSLGNTLNTLFTVVPDMTTFTEWDPVANNFLPVSIFNSATTNWSINYTLNTTANGRGGVLHLPVNASPVINTYVGNVVPYTNIIAELGGPIWHPNYSNGLHLLACPVPVSGTISVMFSNVTGRLPNDGEWVRVLDSATQTYMTATYDSLGGWDTNVTIHVGEAAYFNLGPVAVPEPSSVALVGVATIGLWFSLRRGKPSNR